MTKLLNFCLLAIVCLIANNADAKPFIIGDIHHQLGNQMFEVAATVSLAIDNNAEAIFPDFLTHQEDNIPTNHSKIFYKVKTTIPRTFKPAFFYQETNFAYSPIPYVPNMRISGYFQSEKYFKHNKDKIVSLFSPNKTIVKYLKNKYASIIKDPNTVAIHIRTYSKEDPCHNEFPLNGRDYIEKAIKRFPDDSHFIVFSDNIPWCREALQGIPRNIRFIEGEAYYHDFYLMSMCKHNIISNSTFSWWAAYLNMNPNKVVIAPKNWFTPWKGFDTKDLYPLEWIVID